MTGNRAPNARGGLVRTRVDSSGDAGRFGARPAGAEGARVATGDPTGTPGSGSKEVSPGPLCVTDLLSDNTSRHVCQLRMDLTHAKEPSCSG